MRTVFRKALFFEVRLLKAGFWLAGVKNMCRRCNDVL